MFLQFFSMFIRLKCKDFPASLRFLSLPRFKRLSGSLPVAPGLLALFCAASLYHSPVEAANNNASAPMLAKALRAMQQHNYDDAVKYADAHLEVDPKATNAQFLKAKALFLSHHKIDSLAAYKKCLTMQPSPDEAATALMDMAACAYDAKDFKLSLQYLDKAIAIKPSAYAYGLKAQVYRKQNSETQAEACLRKALKLVPKNYWTARELTDCCITQHKFDDALKTSELLVKLKPNEPEPYKLRAQIYTELGQPAAAKIELEKARLRNDGFPF